MCVTKFILFTYSVHVVDASVSTFDIAVADAADLEARRFLNFEQFVAGIQQALELCQFFAEQNTIDLSGTSVDFRSTPSKLMYM